MGNDEKKMKRYYRKNKRRGKIQEKNKDDTIYKTNNFYEHERDVEADESPIDDDGIVR